MKTQCIGNSCPGRAERVLEKNDWWRHKGSSFGALKHIPHLRIVKDENIYPCYVGEEGTTDRRGRSQPPQCTTSREDRKIVRMAVTDRSVTSRTVAQYIESVTHHSVSARTIQRRLQQSGRSARRPLLVQHLCATPRWSDWSLETPWREDAEQLRYAPPHWSLTGYYGMGWYWISLSHSSSTHCQYFKQPALHLRGVGASCPSLPSGLGHSHISTG
ncbi:transposable element Tcb1 transposase [Trichonephila clavipes]|nr:transposable element Tcb1 transposase [Trichonephila clavipes]